MDMQRIMNNENYIRTGGIGENFFIPMMKNQDYRHKIENEKKNHEEKKAVEQAEKVVNKISDNQFRDVDVAKDSKGKEATAKERYLARKILKDRGLLQSKSQSSVKTAISKDMSRRFSQGGRQ